MFTPTSLTFEMTDDVAATAARENWLAQGRQLFPLGTLALIAISTVIFVRAIRGGSHWLWLLLSGTAPMLFAAMVLIWVAGLWWAPRAARRSLVQLTHRQVVISIGEQDLTVETANERLSVRWLELTELRALPRFWVLMLAGGTQIPVPREAMSAEALAAIEDRMPSR